MDFWRFEKSIVLFALMLLCIMTITWVPLAPSSCIEELVVVWTTTTFSEAEDEVNELDVTFVARTWEISWSKARNAIRGCFVSPSQVTWVRQFFAGSNWDQVVMYTLNLPRLINVSQLTFVNRQISRVLNVYKFFGSAWLKWHIYNSLIHWNYTQFTWNYWINLEKINNWMKVAGGVAWCLTKRLQSKLTCLPLCCDHWRCFRHC